MVVSNRVVLCDCAVVCVRWCCCGDSACGDDDCDDHCDETLVMMNTCVLRLLC